MESNEEKFLIMERYTKTRNFGFLFERSFDQGKTWEYVGYVAEIPYEMKKFR